MDKPKKNWTASEVGNLWNIYYANSLGTTIFKHFLAHCEDEEIKKCINTANSMASKILDDLTSMFNEEGIPTPKAFGKDDVLEGAPRLFTDNFYLFYLDIMLNLGSLYYNVALRGISKRELRNFLTELCVSSLEFSNQVTDVLQNKGMYIGPPTIPATNKIEFVKKESFFNGYFGDKRPLLAMEISHLFYNMRVNSIKTFLCMGFSQVAESAELRDYFMRGKKINIKQHAVLSQIFMDDELPESIPGQFMVTNSVVPPYSDQLMLFLIANLSSAKLRNFGDSLAVSPRRDLGATYGRFMMETGNFAHDGAKLLIKNGWMEQPPSNIDRDKLATIRKK